MRTLLSTPSARLAGTITAGLLFFSAILVFPFTVLASPQEANASASVPALSVILTDGTQAPRPLTTHGHTVADLFQERGITLGSDDKVSPALTASVTDKMPVVITRVHVASETQAAAIPFKTVFKMSHDVAPGHIVKGHRGVPGVLTKTFSVTYTNDQVTSRVLVSKKMTQSPINQETLAGIRVREARALPSRAGTYRRTICLSMTATGYSPYEGSGSGRCATGMRAGYGVVAVDPRLIPLGSRLYIEGYGYAVAGDTGGAIKGHRIDLGHTTHSEAASVGRRHVRVWVLSPTR